MATYDENAVRRMRSGELAKLCDAPLRTATEKLIPELEADGVIKQRGRFWYLRVSEVKLWLLGRWRGAEIR